jgi:hypothetical protein
MSPLPSSASMLCSFSSCAPHPLCSTFLLHFMLCVASAFCMHSLFCVLHVFIMPSPVPDNTLNSSSSLAVILSLFIISGRYPRFFGFSGSYSQSFLFIVGKSVLSPFLHVTTRLSKRCFTISNFGCFDVSQLRLSRFPNSKLRA